VRPEPAPDLPGPLTLRLLAPDRVLFSSDRHWLHPLFELEAFLAQGSVNPAGTLLLDRITGRAAAILMARLGIPQLHTGLLSRRAIPVLERHGIGFRAAAIVEKIDCATEDQLQAIEDLDLAYGLLQERRVRSQAGSLRW
jgi:zinc transport system ATP-binding protein